MCLGGATRRDCFLAAEQDAHYEQEEMPKPGRRRGGGGGEVKSCVSHHAVEGGEATEWNFTSHRQSSEKHCQNSNSIHFFHEGNFISPSVPL